MARRAICIFCRKNNSPLSKEDVLPKWMARAWPVGELFTTKWSIDRQEALLRYSTKGNFGLAVKGPCERCNNTWMSDLESAVRPILLPLMKGESVSLKTDQQLVVARWLLKVAIMYEYVIGRSPRYFTPSVRAAFFETREIPDGSIVSLAQYVGPTAGTVTDKLVQLSYESKGREQPLPAYVFNLTIGRMAMQLFSLQRPESVKGSAVLRLPMSGVWSAAVVDIWPIRGNRLWPLGYHLDDESLGYFAARWDVDPARFDEIPKPVHGV